MTDQLEAISVARRLHAMGGRRGAFQVLVNAAAQAKAAEVQNLTQWVPGGARIPLKERPQPNPAPANDQDPVLHPTA